MKAWMTASSGVDKCCLVFCISLDNEDVIERLDLML